MNVLNEVVEKDYAFYNGDSVNFTQSLPENSLHYILYSPPFSSLYTYSNSDRDMGNCKDDEEFVEHFKFLAKELFRVLKPGRLMSVHCMDLPKMKSRDGVIGLKDFPGLLIRMFEEVGFIYHARVTIWKNPVTEMQRTKALGLLHKQIRKDSSMCRQGCADYVITFRKPGDNEEFISHNHENFPVEVWQQYASPVWMDIRQGDTLQRNSAREAKDEKHICLAEGTLVLTKRGYIPIEDVIPYEDETLTHTGKWQRIIAKAMTRENAEVVKTCAIGVPGLISTPDHKLYAKRYDKTLNDEDADVKEQIIETEPEWIEAQDCDSTYLCSKLPPEMESNISSTEWWIIGKWIGCGTVDEDSGQYFVNVDETESFLESAEEFAGDISENEDGTYCIEIINLSTEAKNVLAKCGKNILDRVLPLEAISLNVELSYDLLAGYISCSHSPRCRALLLGMGLVVQKALGRCMDIMPLLIGDSRCWCINFFSQDCINRYYEGSQWRKVRGVEPAGTANVWSIEVENDHSFMAEGCVVKNCPLQLSVIQRCIELWTNPGDIVYDPFGGIGSVPYVAVRMGRRGIGCELKESYYKQAVGNLERATTEGKMPHIVGGQDVSEFIGEENVNKITQPKLFSDEDFENDNNEECN